MAPVEHPSTNDAPREKFRVGVVTIWEVEAVDFRDAANIAEGATQHAIVTARNPHIPAEVTTHPVINWVRNGEVYEAVLRYMPLELNRSTGNGVITLGVAQPAREDD